MRSILITWAILTLCAYVGCYFYLGTLAQDEVHYANEPGFKAMVSLLLTGGGASIALFLFLFFGSIVRSVLGSIRKRTNHE